MDDWGIPLLIVIIFFVCTFGVGFTYFNEGRKSILVEMEHYGNVRIDEKIYIIEEVINNDK